MSAACTPLEKRPGAFDPPARPSTGGPAVTLAVAAACDNSGKGLAGAPNPDFGMVDFAIMAVLDTAMMIDGGNGGAETAPSYTSRPMN